MNILVICRDNIGDSILATPLIELLHSDHDAVVDVLTNSYAAPVFSKNPHIRYIHKYSKSKPCQGFLPNISAGLTRVMTIYRLWKEKYNAILIAKSAWDSDSLKWTYLIRAKL